MIPPLRVTRWENRLSRPDHLRNPPFLPVVLEHLLLPLSDIFCDARKNVVTSAFTVYCVCLEPKIGFLVVREAPKSEL